MPGLIARILGFTDEDLKERSLRVEPDEAIPTVSPGEPTIQSTAIPVRLPSRGRYNKGHEVAYYPGRGKAVYADPVQDLIGTQDELIVQLKQASALSYGDFDDYILPVIRRYAEYVHLLPASEMDHHADLGGLFRHGLEVAYHASRRCEGKEFGLNEVPSIRKFQFFRWRACALIGGLLHDLGKAVIDVGAVDETGTKIWNPHVQPLFEWTQENGLTHYFVTWSPNRIHREHDVVSATALDRIIPVETKRWLGEYRGRVPYEAMLMALARGQDGGSNPLMEIIRGADMASVDIDKKETHKRMAAIGEGGLRGLGAKFLRTIREKLADGDWKVNEPGQPIWYTDQGLLAMFPTVAKEIIETLRAKGETSIPVDTAAVLNILSDSGLIASSINSDGSSYSVLKFSLQAPRKGGSSVPVTGTAFKFVNDLCIPEYHVMPPPLPVTIYDPTGAPISYGTPAPAESGTTEEDASAAGEGQDEGHSQATSRLPRTGAVEQVSEISFGDDDDDDDGIVVMDQVPDTVPTGPEDDGSPIQRDRASEKDARDAIIDQGREQSETTFPPTTEAQARLWLQEEDNCGPFADVLIERINKGELVANEHYFDKDGCWYFLHNHQVGTDPGKTFTCLEGLGAEPDVVLEQFKVHGWIEPAPGQQNYIIQYRHKGVNKKCIRFTFDHTAVLMLLTGSYRKSKKRTVPEGLGPYLDETLVDQLKNISIHVPADGPIVRGAYYRFLHHITRDTSMQWHEWDYSFTDLKNFAKSHGLVTEWVRNHLVNGELLVGSGEGLSYNPGYDPVADEIAVADNGEQA